jgi:hypothetical protein
MCLSNIPQEKCCISCEKRTFRCAKYLALKLQPSKAEKMLVILMERNGNQHLESIWCCPCPSALGQVQNRDNLFTWQHGAAASWIEVHQIQKSFHSNFALTRAYSNAFTVHPFWFCQSTQKDHRLIIVTPGTNSQSSHLKLVAEKKQRVLEELLHSHSQYKQAVLKSWL